jgi:hypothetical protein
MVDSGKVWRDSIPFIFLVLSLFFFSLDMMYFALGVYADIFPHTTFVYNLVTSDLPFIAAVLAWIATASGGMLMWYGVQKIRPWFLVFCASYAIGMTILFEYLTSPYFRGYT